MSNSILSSLVKTTGPLIESGLTMADRMLGDMRSLVRDCASLGSAAQSSTAARGQPADLDAATSEFANRILRLARFTQFKPNRIAIAYQDLSSAAMKSRPPLELRDWLTLPAELPLSFASLAIQEGLRAVTSAQATPPEHWADFIEFVVEVFSDLHIYFSLQYNEELERWQQCVKERPGDAAARLELGRTYMKCGLFEEATRELEIAAKTPELRHRALYERTVALYRCANYRTAIRDGTACLTLRPKCERTRYWLWLSAQQVGGYPEEVPPELRMEAKDGYHPTTLQLEEVAAEIGLDKVSGGRGTAVLDLDGDGYLDVVIAGAHAGCGLFRNNRDGTFEDISLGSGLDQCVYGFGISAGDYDNDGRPDLYVSSLGFYNGEGRLFHNNGDGTFTDITKDAGVDFWGPGFTATWVDYDLDGRLDLFVANNVGGLFDRKTRNRLFHNNGDGTFTEVGIEAGLHTPWPTIGAAWGDISNDGYPDLIVSGMGRAQLFRNNGDGTFTDISREAGIDAPAIGSAVFWCDIDNDGWLDIVQFTYSRPADAIYTLRHGHGPAGGSPPRIYRNNRDGTFSLVSDKFGITGCWGTMSACAGDITNSGNLDLFLGNGDPSIDRSEASILLENDGSGKFRNVSFSAGLPFTGKGHGVNMADLAGDGRLHLIVASGGLYPGDLQTSAVYRPKSSLGNYLNVRLTGVESNCDAIGARIKLRAGSRDQHRLVSGGSNFGCLPCEQHFGLGELTKVERMEIQWPNGQQQILEDLPVNTTLGIEEGKPGWRAIYAKK